MDKDTIFKAYILIDENKKPLHQFTDTTNFIKKIEDMERQGFENYGGVLDDNYVLIDFDDSTQADIFFNIVKSENVACRVYQTIRGKHFIFKNFNTFSHNATNQLLTCGLRADIKVGTNTSYEVLKMNGHERTILYDIVNSKDDYAKVPIWANKCIIKGDKNFILYPIEDGERNQSLHDWKLKLYRCYGTNLSQLQYKKILEICNKYLTIHPLSKKELSVITRDETENTTGVFEIEKENKKENNKEQLNDNIPYIETEKQDNVKLNPLQIAEQILYNNLAIFKIYNNVLYVYENNTYTKDICAIGRAFNNISKVLGYISIEKRKMVMQHILEISDSMIEKINPRYINFKNGIYDLYNDELLKHTSNIFTINQIPHNYNKDVCYSDYVENYLLEVSNFDKGIKNLIYEAIGYGFISSCEMKKAFIFHGGHDNGKSVLCDLVFTAIFGENNSTYTKLHQLSDRFMTSSISDKLVCLGDDIENKTITNTGLLKSIISGNTIKVEEKGDKPYDMTPYATIYCSCNEIPRIKNDTSGAMAKRLIYIPLHNTFKRDGQKLREIRENIIENEQAIEYIIKKSLECYYNVIVNKEFTECEQVKQLNRIQCLEDNPFNSFLEETFQTKETIQGKSTTDFYKEFEAYCEDNDVTLTKRITQTNFTKQIKALYNLDVVKCNIRVDDKIKTSRVFE